MYAAVAIDGAGSVSRNVQSLPHTLASSGFSFERRKANVPITTSRSLVYGYTHGTKVLFQAKSKVVRVARLNGGTRQVVGSLHQNTISASRSRRKRAESSMVAGVDWYE
jgi:hypothetical protein